MTIEADISHAVQLYAIPVTLGIGVLSNIFVFLVIRRFTSILSTCVYLALSGIVDCLVLCFLAGNAWIRVLHGTDIRHKAQHHSNSLCKMYPFVENVIVHMSVWLLSAASIETAIVTLKAKQLRLICTKERARAAILLIFVILVCINAHSFWTYALVQQEKSVGKTYVTCSNVKQGNIDSEEFRRIAWPVIDFVLSDLAPFFILFSSSVIVLTRRLKRSDTLRNTAQMWKLHTLDASTVQELQKAIITLAICHLCLILPKFSYDIFEFLESNLKLWKKKGSNNNNQNQNQPQSTEEDWLEKKLLARELASLCVYCLLAIKFFVYSFVSYRFRVEVVNVLTCCCKSRTSSPVIIPPPPPSATSNHYSSRCVHDHDPLLTAQASSSIDITTAACQPKRQQQQQQPPRPPPTKTSLGEGDYPRHSASTIHFSITSV